MLFCDHDVVMYQGGMFALTWLMYRSSNEGLASYIIGILAAVSQSLTELIGQKRSVPPDIARRSGGLEISFIKHVNRDIHGKYIPRLRNRYLSIRGRDMFLNILIREQAMGGGSYDGADRFHLWLAITCFIVPVMVHPSPSPRASSLCTVIHSAVAGHNDRALGRRKYAQEGDRDQA